MKKGISETYIRILEEELVPAMGCTEPIAIAYAGALAKRALGALPQRVRLVVSGNIIKNVKSVVVPNTGGRKGMQTAVAAGICFGDPDKELEVISCAGEEDLCAMDEFLERTEISIEKSPSENPFDIQLHIFCGEDCAYVRIIGQHTNVVRIEKNGEAILSKDFVEKPTPPCDRDKLNVADIIEFADSVDLEKVRPVLKRQIDYNMAIAEAGLCSSYGANIGKILLQCCGDGMGAKAKAWAAAGSDARMSGCELPVVINSGSGNQGITASVPVIVYAEDLGCGEEKLLRSLLVSNLVTIHLKTGIGSLSAYCGATSAGAGAAAGINYMRGGSYREISNTIVNALAINSGMICDGAKPSCAAKIASAVESGLLGMEMIMHGSRFCEGEGIVIKDVESTIAAVSRIAREGMRSTDDEIIHQMIDV